MSEMEAFTNGFELGLMYCEPPESRHRCMFGMRSDCKPCLDSTGCARRNSLRLGRVGGDGTRRRSDHFRWSILPPGEDADEEGPEQGGQERGHGMTDLEEQEDWVGGKSRDRAG